MKKVLLISTSSHELSNFEFVLPIANILDKRQINFDLININDKKLKLNDYQSIIICGNAMKDNYFLNEKHSWLSKVKIPILGICAGMQILCKLKNIKLKKNSSIGLKKVEIISQNPLLKSEFNSYFVHSNIPIINSNSKDIEILAKCGKNIAAIKIKDKQQYGVLFHPEVRNEDIILNFLEIT